MLVSFAAAVATPSSSMAQTEEKVKVKKTSTPGQKVANTFRKKRNKKYKGVKVKHKVEAPSKGTSSN